ASRRKIRHDKNLTRIGYSDLCPDDRHILIETRPSASIGVVGVMIAVSRRRIGMKEEVYRLETSGLRDADSAKSPRHDPRLHFEEIGRKPSLRWNRLERGLHSALDARWARDCPTVVELAAAEVCPGNWGDADHFCRKTRHLILPVAQMRLKNGTFNQHAPVSSKFV